MSQFHLFWGIPLVLFFSLLELVALFYFLSGVNLYLQGKKEASGLKIKSSVITMAASCTCLVVFPLLFYVIWNSALTLAMS